MSETEEKKVDDSIPDSAQICRCGHSKERHRETTKDKTICVERFCPCSNFVLSRVK
jgi:hypothetical protein